MFLKLCSDDTVSGIILQLPLDTTVPTDATKCTNAISVMKDVDGLTDSSLGALASGDLEVCMLPCTPLGCLRLIEKTGVNISGKKAVVIGRSKIVVSVVVAQKIKIVAK